MKPTVTLRDADLGDLPIFFEHQNDDQSNQMAAFTRKAHADWNVFQTHWAKVLGDESILVKAVLSGDQLVGYVLCHNWFGPLELSYWFGRAYWGQGIASQAVAQFLNEVPTRPLLARIAADNQGSLRVLQKCGFIFQRAELSFSEAREEEIEELILELPGP